MLILKCKMCGGDLELIDGKSTAECQHCGTVQTLPSADNEKKIRLFNQANKLRMSLEFDRAASIYENIIAEFPEEAEGYWGLCLCNYGIEYVKDPATGERKPTCLRASFEKLTDDENFKNALDYADMLAKRQYTIEAREIDRINEEILSVSKNEKPYDIFICYKETDENNERTIDSLIAEKIYDMLTDKGYKVFFSRITLEDKIGMLYEPYIFAALNSAKIMLCIGTKYEHFHAVWVKNEWSRFLRLGTKDKSKVIIPCFKDCDPYIDLPQEFKALQAQDLGKVGAENDLIRGIEKILGKKQEEAPVQKQVVVNTATGATTETFLTRAKLSLEAGDFSSANKFCESALNMDPENSDAYLYKLLADMQIKNIDALSKGTKEFTDNVNYQRAYRFGNEKRKEWLTFCVNSVIYNIADKTMVSAESSYHFNKAAQIFNRIPNFKDAAVQSAKCLQFKELAEAEEDEARKESIYQAALKLKEKEYISDTNDLQKAITEFNRIIDYKDANKQIEDCESKIVDFHCNRKRYKNIELHDNKVVILLSVLHIVSFIGFFACFGLGMVDIFGLTSSITGMIISFVNVLVLTVILGILDDRVGHALLYFYFYGVISLNNTDSSRGIKNRIKKEEEEIEKFSAKTGRSFTENILKSENEIKKIKNSYKIKKWIAIVILVVEIVIIIIEMAVMPAINISKENDNYGKAVELLEEGRYNEAYNLVAEIKKEEAAELTVKILTARQKSSLKGIEIGDTVNFGFGIIDDNLGADTKEMDWLVLDVVDGKALIIQNSYVNHTVNYIDDDETWENSEVRGYLNNEFIVNSFNNGLEDMLVMTDVVFDGNPGVDYNEENSTQDKVFLLSVLEAEKYFEDNADRIFMSGDGEYAQAKEWYLRSPGDRGFLVPNRTGVDTEGAIWYSSSPYEAVIRAAMWIDISNID